MFVASTTGDGEVPSNMATFWKFLLRRDLPPQALEDVHVAVFGLGDSRSACAGAVIVTHRVIRVSDSVLPLH